MNAVADTKSTAEQMKFERIEMFAQSASRRTAGGGNYFYFIHGVQFSWIRFARIMQATVRAIRSAVKSVDKVPGQGVEPCRRGTAGLRETR